ncbi:MAG: hypothetical protein ABI200_03245 [Gaiellales bacterium]
MTSIDVAAFAPQLRACPPPAPGPPPPPAAIPPGAPRDFKGMYFGRATGVWWRAGDSFQLRIDARVGNAEGYGRWSEAVAAAAAMSAGRAGAIAVCDDRGRLYLHEIRTGCGWGKHSVLRMGERSEAGYLFYNQHVRGIIDGDLIATRGDCLENWVPRPTPAA